MHTGDYGIMAESEGQGQGNTSINSLDERTVFPPATVKVLVEIKTHGDKYSTKDLLVDTSLFKWNDSPLFSSTIEKVAAATPSTRRQHSSRRGRGRGRGMGSSVIPNRRDEGDKEQMQPWVTGHCYYFCIDIEGSAPLVLKGHTAPPARTGWPAQFKVSIHERIAGLRGIASGLMVHISPIPRDAWHQYELEHVEVTILDSFVSRSDVWGALQMLRHSTVYIGKKVLMSGHGTMAGAWATVKAMIKTNSKQPCSSGIIVDNTKLTMRSLSARIMLMIQISREMFTYGTEDEGDTYFSRAVDMLIRELVKKWRKAGCSHNVTLVLFAKLEVTGDTERDYVRPVWHGNDDSDWEKVPSLLKSAVNSMISDMRAMTPLHPSDLGDEGLRLSTARNGNVVEAINLALNSIARHHIDRSLNRTGQAIIVITAGSGLIHTTRQLSRLTAQRILDTGTGCDMICLGRPPLHVSPVFEYSSGSDSFVYERPSWMSVRFYCNRPATVGSTQCELLNYEAAVKMFQSSASFIPQCRMTSARNVREEELRRSNGYTLVTRLLAKRNKEGHGKLLPPDWRKRDQQAFASNIEPIKWTEDKEPKEDSECRELLSVYDSPKSRLSPKMRHMPSSSIISDIDEGRIRSSSICDEQKASWSASPTSHPLCGHHKGSLNPTLSPTKQLEDYHRKTQESGLGPKPVLIPPFVTTGCRVKDATDPLLIQQLQLDARDPFEQANSARWSHMYPVEMSFCTGMNDNHSCSWKFIIEPALLPLTSPYYPVPDAERMIPGFEIHHSNKTPSSTGVVPVPSGVAGMRAFLHECVVQRLHQGYQFIPPVVDKTYRLSIGHQFHEISTQSQFDYVFVQWVHQEYRSRQQPSLPFKSHRYTPPSPAILCKTSPMLQPMPTLASSHPGIRGKLSMEGFEEDGPSADLMEFNYQLHNPFTRGWDFRKIQFHNESGNVYVNWSGLDQLISGTQDAMEIENKNAILDPLFMARKVKFAIIPQKEHTGGGFKEEVKRWLDQICSGSEFHLLSKEKLESIVFEEGELDFDFDIPQFEGIGTPLSSMSATIPSGQVLPQSHSAPDAKPLELVLEGQNSRKGMPLPPQDEDDGAYQPDVKPPESNVDTACNACPVPDVMSRSTWFSLGINRTAHPLCHLSFNITWLACPGCKIAEFVDLCRRRMLQTMGQSHILVQIPCASLASGENTPQTETRTNPLTPYTWTQVSSCLSLRMIIMQLIKHHGYTPSTNHVTFGCVLLHITGESMIHVPKYDQPHNGIGMYYLKNRLAKPSAYLDARHYDEFVRIVESWELCCDIVTDLVADALEDRRGPLHPSRE
eukprot:TRINITY_DN17_c1_g1_i1.p1 TRINITY_DN17_c1_g1~~TRINITY_DN17_c1_g1_i1.p1  ORF type:complete len:1322 (+),score=329.74 TRINITY_DN17_c1_g1_i1:3247-7212(+)